MSDNTSAKPKLGKKSKIVLGVLAMFLVLILCTVVISQYAKTLVTEGTVDLAAEPVALTPLPKNGDEIIGYIKTLVSSAQDSTAVSVDMSTELSIDESAMTAVSSDAELNILKFAKNSVLSKASAMYPSHEGTFGDSFADYPQIDITAADASELAITQGKKNDMGETQDDNYYFFSVLLPDFDYPVPVSSPVYTTFGMDKIDGIITSLEAEVASMVTVKGVKIACSGFSFEGRADRFTNQLDYLNISRKYLVTLDVEFIGDYASFGVSQITFPLTATDKYDYTMAGFTFAQDKLTLYEGEEETLGINAIIADDATAEDYELIFASSDANIASVDENGNVTGVKVSPTPVVITATFIYMGHTYVDSCDVYVTVPVRRITVSPAALSLKVGESGQLAASLEPEDATITGVKWFTEDETIAVIDESGVVTAVGAGTVKVYAVSEEGGFRASCTVTVTALGGAG